jgi:tetratricopeptide (TPR) repeat protein
LPTYEKEEPAMNLALNEFLPTIDLKKEDRRLENVEFATSRQGKLVRAAGSVEVAENLSVVETLLRKGETLLRENKVTEARLAFEEALKQPEEKASLARAKYGLARILFFQRRDPELVLEAFNKVLSMKPDDSTQAFTLLHLGLVQAAIGEREEAAKFFEATVAAPNAPSAAVSKAQTELGKLKK